MARYRQHLHACRKSPVNHSRRPLYSHGSANRDHFQQRRGCNAITIGNRNRHHRRLECPAIHLYHHHRRFAVVRHSNRIPNQSYGHGPWRLPSEGLFPLRITTGDPHGNLRANANPYRGPILNIFPQVRGYSLRFRTVFNH